MRQYVVVLAEAILISGGAFDKVQPACLGATPETLVSLVEATLTVPAGLNGCEAHTSVRRRTPGMPASTGSISGRGIFFLSVGGAIIILGNKGHSLHYSRLGESGATAGHTG